jgi:hypothetical protein
MTDLTFIETQFPVSKLSKESYKERSAKNSQTLTGLGKWWGRKPLIMVRAAIIGLLLPATSDPKKDRDIFLKILTMDEDGLWQRKTKAIPLKEVFERLTPAERQQWFVSDSSTPSPLVLIITHIYSSSCWPARKPARKPATSKVKACNPRHRVLTPGMPSFLRFRWPPNRAIHWMA